MPASSRADVVRPPRVRSHREEGQERRVHTRAHRRNRATHGGVGTARTHVRCTDWLTSSREKGQERFLLASGLEASRAGPSACIVHGRSQKKMNRAFHLLHTPSLPHEATYVVGALPWCRCATSCTVLSAGLARATHRGTADAAAAPLALSSSRRCATAPAARSARVSEHVRAQKGLRPRRGRCHWQGARVERCGVGRR